MNEINIKEIIQSKNPTFLKSLPHFLREIVFLTIRKLIHESKINDFLESNSEKKDFEFIEELFEYLDISYKVSSKDKAKIPSEGKLIIVANHPLGGLDGLILLKLISEVRKDVKIIVNDILLNVDNLKNLFLPYDITNNTLQKENVAQIIKSLNNEEAIIIFPAGEVSRMYLHGVNDSKWNKGAVYFADKFNAPILPVWVEGRNSLMFYLSSWLYKGASTFFLPNELFNKYGETFNIKIGNYILPKSISFRGEYKSKYLKKHIKLIGRDKKGIFKTEKNIIHPVNRKELKKELQNSELLGKTSDEKLIYLVEYSNSKNILSEIARLREITFRKVGEGTGNKKDTDFFDKHYKHLVLWDEKELEIAGAYRLGIAEDIYPQYGHFGLYTSTLFNFSSEFISILPKSVELGRSFIQQKYWNSMALDYLWQGIGAFMSKYPNYKYLFGPVSLSNSYPAEAKDLIIYFYKKYFGKEGIVESKNRYIFNEQKTKELESIFIGENQKENYLILKNRLKYYGCSIPVLFKQYSELGEDGGVLFYDFGTDKDFQNCVDGFIIVNTDMIKESKKERYFNSQKITLSNYRNKSA